ncbi:MAG: purine-nucleoside phosphorylase [Bacilli bacterium]|jgi:purine-nucleoside phosphorylase|nr:purine-nucleoside phosphorylase [Bacilli bacterium]
MNEEINTAHINPKGKIAKTVLMPGDPLRAKYIADTFLDNVVQFNDVRGMLGFTGNYKGKEISVMGSGMGMPSIGIYSYELFNVYGVENIIRIGSAGGYTKDMKLYDVFLCTEAYSESTFAIMQSGFNEKVLKSSPELNDRVREYAKKLNIPLKEGRVHSSDVFYYQNPKPCEKYANENNCDCVEMESFALFNNARALNKKATCLVTISDNLLTQEETTSEERQTAFNEMMKIALEFAQ